MEEVDEREIKQISEETAQELCDMFEKHNKMMQERAQDIERLFGSIKEMVAAEISKHFVFLADRYANANCLTRWYWKRKMKNFVKGIDVLDEL